MNRRSFLKAGALGMVGLGFDPRWASAAEPSETLYNGIVLASPWPPRNRYPSADPIAPPYLAEPPAVIPIDVGRQLFVDDFLIQETTLQRTYHAAEYHAGNPILRPLTPWERRDTYAERTRTMSNPAAMVFSDGVFYDPGDERFKMWYMGGYSGNTCYAVSENGIQWEKPALDVVSGTNIVLPGHRDSTTVWLDLVEKDPERRYKMSLYHDAALTLFVSGDGIHWREVGRSGPTGDRSTFFYNPFRKVWVFSLRDEEFPARVRFRRYWEHPDFVAGARWKPGEPSLWAVADSHDLGRDDLRMQPQLYNLDCVAYESLLLGLFTMWRGERQDREKPNEVCLGFSRDGFHWHRPERRAFLPVSESVGAWNWANVQSAGGCCLIVGDRLYFYVSGRKGVPGTSSPGVCATGLAMLRRDGFASMVEMPEGSAVRRLPTGRTPDASLTTRPVHFRGKYLFVNADVAGGELRVEVLDANGKLIPPFSRDNCLPLAENGTRLRVGWKHLDELSTLAGEPVRFRFFLTRGRLYAFWISPSVSGASHGYVAAGGPGLPGLTDTVGGS